MGRGILDRPIAETPIAIIDFETTGLTPGADRIVEASVVRVEPGQQPRLVFDTLINPLRPMAATEIHGITDEDVASAPRFSDIAGDLLGSLSDCVLASYNVYFDLKFLNFELRNVGVRHEPPHFCLMYMRTLLGLGSRCRLDEACRCFGIRYDSAHVAAADATACGQLLSCYARHCAQSGVITFDDLRRRGSYKFLNSFDRDPFASPSAFGLTPKKRVLSRSGHLPPVDPIRRAMSAYWDVLKVVLADLDISDEELDYVVRERSRLGLSKEQLRVQHARAFASVIVQFTADQWLDDAEVVKLRRLYQCLSRLGWAPGE